MVTVKLTKKRLLIDSFIPLVDNYLEQGSVGMLGIRIRRLTSSQCVEIDVLSDALVSML